MLNGNGEFNFIFSEWGSLFGIFFLIILSAFFSGSETALTASSRAKLRSMTDRGSKGAKKALKITNDNESLIGTLTKIWRSSASGPYSRVIQKTVCIRDLTMLCVMLEL